MADDEEQNPLDQLMDMFVYAPIGLLYEYEEVMPRLVKRGKSQVKLARVIGQLAVNRGKDGPAATAGQVGELITLLAARGLTDLGRAIGLAPPQEDRRPAEPATPPPPTEVDRIPTVAGTRELAEGRPEGNGSAPIEAGAVVEPEASVAEEDRPLPIAGYDDLTAKVIIPLLDDLTTDQLARIRAHEEANRARKTVLGKLDRLGA